MSLASWLSTTVPEAAWLGAGVLIGVSLVALVHRLQARREARLAEWDPY